MRSLSQQSAFCSYYTTRCFFFQFECPSQRDHVCLLSDEQELIDIYFDRMLEKLDEHQLLIDWCSEVCNTHISSELIAEYQMYKCSSEWKETHSNKESWKEHIKTILRRMICLENRIVGKK